MIQNTRSQLVRIVLGLGALGLVAGLPATASAEHESTRIGYQKNQESRVSAVQRRGSHVHETRVAWHAPRARGVRVVHQDSHAFHDHGHHAAMNHRSQYRQPRKSRVVEIHHNGRGHYTRVVRHYNDPHQGAFHCHACSMRFQTRNSFFDHIHHHHHVPLIRIPFLIVHHAIGWIFYG